MAHIDSDRKIKNARRHLISKRILLLILAFMFLNVFAISSLAAEESDDVTQLIESMNSYFDKYLPGLNSVSKKAISDTTEAGMRADKNKYFMPMMSSLRLIREAGESGKDQNITDVINQYHKLGDAAKKVTSNGLTDAFKGIFFDVTFDNNIMTLSSAGKKITEIKFSSDSSTTVTTTATKPGGTTTTTKAPAASETESNAVTTTTTAANAHNQAMVDAANSGVAVDVTTLYINAYLPGFNQIDAVKAVIKKYSEAGGGPEGSGALWRCIREIGGLMGREVTVATDYSGFTVQKEGEGEFLKLSSDIQEKIIQKVTEGMTGIAVTTAYKDGTFTFTKLGEVQFEYTVKGAAKPVAADITSSPATLADKDAKGGINPLVIIIPVGVCLAVVIILLVFKDKIFKKKY